MIVYYYLEVELQDDKEVVVQLPVDVLELLHHNYSGKYK